jgi:hypothetical protein
MSAVMGKTRPHLKKEPLAGALLAALFIGSLINISELNRLGAAISSKIDDAAYLARSGDWDGATAAASAAAAAWEDSGVYTHIVLRHTVIEDVSDKLWDLAKAVYSRSPGETAGAAMSARARVESTVSIERVRLGSIF